MDINKTIFSKISNTIFLIICTLTLIFIWINYYIKNIRKSLWSSIIITFVICIIYYLISKYKNRKNTLNKNKLKFIEIVKNQFLYGKNKDIVKTLSKLFNLQILQYKNSDTHYLDKAKKIDYYFLFYNENLTTDEIQMIYKTRVYNKIIIYCFNKINILKLENINIEFITFETIYELFKNNFETIDKDIKILKKPKFRLKEVLCIIFNKEKTRGYFYFGITLIFSSLFTLYPLYYIIFGSILLCFSMFSKFNKLYN